MDYQGRSPLKDITRSVIMGAAMIPAAMLAGCSRQRPPENPAPTGGNVAVGDAGAMPVIAMPVEPGSPPDVVVLAPPPEVVRPRVPIGGTSGSMPTRGFAGAVRVRA